MKQYDVPYFLTTYRRIYNDTRKFSSRVHIQTVNTMNNNEYDMFFEKFRWMTAAMDFLVAEQMGKIEEISVRRAA